MVGVGVLDFIYKLCLNFEIFKYEIGDVCIGYE